MCANLPPHRPWGFQKTVVSADVTLAATIFIMIFMILIAMHPMPALRIKWLHCTALHCIELHCTSLH
jgi:hypothetical protein